MSQRSGPVLAKVKRHIIPIAVLGLFIAMVDRVNIGVAGSSMSHDVGLSPASFGLAAGLFYVGYVLFEIPSNIAMRRFRARLWISRIMFTWGLVTVLTMLIASPVALYVLRFLLGAAEAGFYPGILLWFGHWFAPAARARAYSLFQLGIPLSLAVGSVLTSLLLRMDGALGLAGWQWVFLLEGGAAILVGLLNLRVMPNGPEEARWLSPLERAELLETVGAEPESAGHGRHAIGAVLRSGTAWYHSGCYFFMMVGFWAVTYWLPQIIENRFTIGPSAAGFLSALPWVVSAVSLLVVSRAVDRIGRRRTFLIGCLVVCAGGLAVSSVVGSPVLALLGLCLAACVQAGVPLLFTFPAEAFGGDRAAVALALVNSVGSIGGFVGPTLIGWLAELTGSNRFGLLVLSASFLIAALMAAGLRSRARTAVAA